MGIYNFFWNWIRSEQAACLSFITPEYTIPSPDILLIDANSIFHPVFNKLFTNDPSTTHVQIQQAICKRLYSITQLVRPHKTVYIAIDGVAGCCKQSQQRKRRFKSILDQDTAPIPIQDTIHITAGTQFMTDLCNTIRHFFSQLPSLTVNVILDDMFVPGEGEHKLIHFMKQDLSHSSYMIYSPDADLMMLTLGLNKSNVTILRVNDQQNSTISFFAKDSIYDHFLIHIDRLRVILSSQYRWQSTKQPFVKSRFFIDLVMMLFILGNDFLPHIDHIKIPTGGIEMLIQIYRRVIPITGFLVDVDSHQINVKAMIGITQILAKEEPSLILQKHNRCQKKQNCFPYPVLDRAIEVGLDDKVSLNFSTFRSGYYKKAKITSVEDCCREYYRGMSFVIQYYTRKIPTYDWFYPYDYPPLCYDLYQYATKFDLSFVFEYQPPLSLYEALFSVIPPSKSFVLPDFLQPLMNRLGRTDPEFSEEIRVDRDGKENEYKAIVLVPAVAYTKIKHLLSEFNLQDPQPRVYTVSRKLAPTPQYTAKYTLAISGKVDSSKRSAAGVVLSTSAKKILEYGKFISPTSSLDATLGLVLNDTISWIVRKVGRPMRKGVVIRIVSEHRSFIESVKDRKISRDDNLMDIQRQTQILIRQFLEPTGYRVEYGILDERRNIEAKEVVEDVLTIEEDIYHTF